MSADSHQSMFARLKASQLSAGLTTAGDNLLLCPLCWVERTVDEFSVEHIVPGAVGGDRKTLTCRFCNNTHGGALDAHLAAFQRSRDAFRGHGTLPTDVYVNGHRMATRLQPNARQFSVVDKASNPNDIMRIRDDFASAEVSQFTATISFGYAKNQFQTAVLRAAYLALFDRLGYSYVSHDCVQAIRRRICDLNLEEPDPSLLIIELGTPKMPYDEPLLFAHCLVKDIPCIFVIVRVRMATTTYLGAYMPNTTHPIEFFCALMEECKRENHGKSITLRKEDLLI